MLISSRHKFIFFHIPKAAGSSITTALQGYSDYPFARLYHYMYDIFGQQPAINLYYRHIKPREIRGYLKQEKFNSCFKFAFVRNPWDWNVSQYHYHVQNSNAYFHERLKGKSFEDYVHWASENLEEANALQYDFLSDNNGELLVNYVGKFENLETDFDNICEAIGLDVKLKHVNQSKRADKYRSYYSDETQKLIGKIHEKDIDAFKYTF